MQRLQEKFIISKESINKLPLTEGLEIEEKDGKKLKCRAAYEIPVWRLDEKNLNNRVYSSKLAEKVIKEKNTTLGLANHPTEEADVTMSFAVEKNPHIKENVFYVDAYLVGQHGELAKEIIEAGGEIGLSSSALGDVDKDGNVLTEGFTVERFADWVDNPSYQVFVGQNGNLEGKLKPKKEENVKDFIKNGTNIKEHITVEENLNFVSTNIIDKENKNMSNKEDKKLSIEEKNLRLGVKNLFEKAESKNDLQEKLNAYHEVVEYCDGVDIAEDYVNQANSKIEEIQKEIYELANKGKELDQVKESSEKTLNETKEELNKLKEDHNLLAEKYDRAVELLEKMKEREKKLKELYEISLAEKNGMVTAGEYKELQVFTEEKENEIDELKEEVSKLKKKLKKYIGESVKGKEKPSEKQEAEDKDKDKDDKKKKKDDDEEEEMEPEDEKGDVKDDDKKEEGIFDFRNNKDVERYYEDLVEENSNVEKIKDDILQCKTLFEAQRKYLTLRDLVEDDFTPNSAKQVHLEEEEKLENQRNFNLNVRKGWL